MHIMKIDFKKELETASKGMIMIHDPHLLIKLIVRMIVRKLSIRHVAMILYDPEHDAYVLSISKGERGLKVPPGFAKFNRDSAMIKVFIRNEFKHLISDRNAIVTEDINKIIWRESIIQNGNGSKIKEVLHQVNDQMQMLNVEACVPAYFRDDLMAVLLLGEKSDGTRFDQEELDFFGALASDAAMAIRNAQLFEGLKAESERNRKLFIQTIIVLGSTIEAKDAYTRGHVDRVTKYANAIAREMSDRGMVTFNSSFFENLYIAGLLHDIGKIGIPESILNKKGPLTDEEYEIMKGHTLRGVEIITPLNLHRDVVHGIKYHHETYDGKGYPEGLNEDNIPIIASILSVADAFDAMTTDRPYRKGFPKEDAIKEIKRKTGSQFHPLPAKIFIQLCQKGMI